MRIFSQAPLFQLNTIDVTRANQIKSNHIWMDQKVAAVILCRQIDHTLALSKKAFFGFTPLSKDDPFEFGSENLRFNSFDLDEINFLFTHGKDDHTRGRECGKLVSILWNVCCQYFFTDICFVANFDFYFLPLNRNYNNRRDKAKRRHFAMW